jgi:hypothetical protein
MKTLNQQKTIELLKQYKSDYLTKKLTEILKVARTATCPVCKQFDNEPVLDINESGVTQVSNFQDNVPEIRTVNGLPKYLSKCNNCQATFEPDLGLVYSL